MQLFTPGELKCCAIRAKFVRLYTPLAWLNCALLETMLGRYLLALSVISEPVQTSRAPNSSEAESHFMIHLRSTSRHPCSDKKRKVNVAKQTARPLDLRTAAIMSNNGLWSSTPRI